VKQKQKQNKTIMSTPVTLTPR